MIGVDESEGPIWGYIGTRWRARHTGGTKGHLLMVLQSTRKF